MVQASIDEDSAELDNSVERCQLSVLPEHHQQRIDTLFVKLLPAFSRAYFQQLISDGLVQLDGKPVARASQRAKAGQVYQLSLRPTPQSTAFVSQTMPIDTVYVDEHIRVINKPAGLVVHPAAGNWSGTLLNGLLALDPAVAALPRAGIVHRLDKDTSGLMALARSAAAASALVKKIASREVKRQYLALAHQHWQQPKRVEVTLPIGRDPRQRSRMAVVDLRLHSGKEANTGFELRSNSNSSCLLLCTLGTGRTHQIRVHAAALGHPLIGDTLYGGAAAAGLLRQGLHAWRLALDHPVSGLKLEFEQNLPQDMQLACTQLGHAIQ